MKKLLLLSVLLFALLALTACGGNDNSNNDTANNQGQAHDAYDSLLSAVSESGPLSLDTPFTWDGIEITFHDNISFVSFERGISVERIDEDGRSRFDTFEAIRLPVTITNPQDRPRAIDDFTILGPYSDQEGRIRIEMPGTLRLLDSSFIAQNIDESYEWSHRVEPGQTSETYFYIPYVKDGNYRIVFQISGTTRILSFPVTRGVYTAEDTNQETAIGLSREEFIAEQDLFANTLTGHLPLQRRRIHVGYNFSKIVCDNSILWATGANESARFGTENLGRFQINEPIPILENVASVVGNFNGSLVVTNGGALWHIGISPRLGVDRNIDLFGLGLDSSFQGYPVRLLDNIVDVSSTISHALALTSNGDVWIWGHNDNAQVIYPPSLLDIEPSIIMQNAVYVHAGAGSRGTRTSFVITDTGDVYVWGQITLNRPAASPGRYEFTTPTRIEGIGELININYSDNVITGVRTDGTAITIENAHVVEHTDGVFTVDPLVWTLEERNAVSSIVVGSDGSLITRLIMSDNGWLQGVGRNNFGILNPDSNRHDYNAFQVIRDDIAYFAASAGTIIAIDLNGQFWGWGNNQYGQLGLGFASNREGFTALTFE